MAIAGDAELITCDVRVEYHIRLQYIIRNHLNTKKIMLINAREYCGIFCKTIVVRFDLLLIQNIILRSFAFGHPRIRFLV